MVGDDIKIVLDVEMAEVIQAIRRVNKTSCAVHAAARI